MLKEPVLVKLVCEGRIQDPRWDPKVVLRLVRLKMPSWGLPMAQWLQPSGSEFDAADRRVA